MFTAQKGIMQGHGYEIVTLAGAGHEVRILPENGFNLYYWTYEGKEIFMEPADITVFGTKYGNPILFPTPDRVKDAAYTWRGETRVMKKRGQEVLIHGLVKDEPFTVTDIQADECSARCSAKSPSPPSPAWSTGKTAARTATWICSALQPAMRR